MSRNMTGIYTVIREKFIRRISIMSIILILSISISSNVFAGHFDTISQISYSHEDGRSHEGHCHHPDNYHNADGRHQQEGADEINVTGADDIHRSDSRHNAVTGSDYNGHWAESMIKEFLRKGYIHGYPDGSFRPDREITRAEFFALINRAFGFEDKADITFYDVPRGSWFEDEICKAVKAGYLSGYGDGSVRPDSAVKRVEAAIILSALLKWDSQLSEWGYKEKTGADKIDINSIKDICASCHDAEAVPAWGENAFYSALTLGYFRISPDNWIQPYKNITRAEAVALLYKAEAGDIGDNHVPDAPAEREIKGVLYTACCKGKPPEKETKACLLNPGCAANGYGINVRQADGSYEFLPFDSRGNELAKSILAKTEKYANITITAKAVEGAYPGNILKVLALEENDLGIPTQVEYQAEVEYQEKHKAGQEEKQTKRQESLQTERHAQHHAGQQAATHMHQEADPHEKQETRYMGQETNPHVDQPASQHAEQKTVQTLEGVLIDEHCFAFGEPENDPIECLRMKKCEESGYGVAVKQRDGTYKFYKFDEPGQNIAKEILRNTRKENNIVVIAKGVVDGGTIRIAELSEKTD